MTTENKEIKITNFICSEHGKQKPIIKCECPKCHTPAQKWEEKEQLKEALKGIFTFPSEDLYDKWVEFIQKLLTTQRQELKAEILGEIKNSIIITKLKVDEDDNLWAKINTKWNKSSVGEIYLIDGEDIKNIIKDK